MHTTTVLLPYSGDVDWPATLRFLAARAIHGVEEVVGQLYRRTVRLDAQIGLLEVAPHPEARALEASFRLPSPVDDSTTVMRLRRMFDLDADLPRIGAHLAGDAAMAPLVAAHPGLRVFGGWDGFEVAVRTINGQQVSIARARQLNGVVVARATAEVTLESGSSLHRVFPSPQEVLAADLAGMGMPGARIAAITNMAAAAAADPRLFDADHSLEDTIARLKRIRGIGDWTAHYIAMRACRQADAFPASDVGLLRGAADATGRRPTPAALLARAEAWRPWRAYAAHHLWAADSSASAGVRESTRPATVGA